MTVRITATIQDEARAAEWRRWLGTDTVPLKSASVTFEWLPGFAAPQSIYLLDVEQLTAEQVDRLAHGLSQKFEIPYDEVRTDIVIKGVPIVAANTEMRVTPVARK